MEKDFKTNWINTDVLVVGGGIAGCMAGIRARQCGVDVVLAEKANTKRSGSAGTGVDHFWTYAPEVHEPLGFTVEDLVIDHTRAAGGFNDQELTEYQAKNSFARFLDWERWGIKIRGEDGKLDPVGKIHRVKTFMHFSGRDLKPILTQQAKYHGVNIHNRTMVVDLIVEDDRVVGAVGIQTEKNEVVCFLAKAVVLATGAVMRLYRNPTGLLFNTPWSPNVTGDGRAMAYRAGAKLINMEIPDIHTGIRNFQRCGRGSYYPGGVLKDAMGRPLTEYVADRIDQAIESPHLIREIIRSGRGPVFMDCTEASETDLKYIRWALSNEGQWGFLSYLDQEGINLKTHKLEFSTYEMFLGMRGQGIKTNIRCETSVLGLYVCGDDMGGAYRMVSPGAATFGWVAGENAAEYAKNIEAKKSYEVAEAVTQRVCQMSANMLSTDTGTTWQDANLAIQNIMDFYAGEERSESMLRSGLDFLQEIKTLALAKMKASNAHELMRCFEVLNLAQIGEIVMLCSINRRETRPELNFFRSDYPEKKEEFSFQTIQLKNGIPQFSWEPIQYKYEWRVKR
jgi:succinate dehydrogenase/fumarate reductase flavoprotein subunit